MQNQSDILTYISAHTHTPRRSTIEMTDAGKPIVLERPSSQMSYLDHFLKESGSTTNTTHTTSSTIAINMVSFFCGGGEDGEYYPRSKAVLD